MKSPAEIHNVEVRLLATAEIMQLTWALSQQMQSVLQSLIC
jgi:hypothetical protein